MSFLPVQEDKAPNSGVALEVRTARGSRGRDRERRGFRERERRV